MSDASIETLERALCTLGRRSPKAADGTDYAVEVVRTIVGAVMERTNRPLLSLDDDDRFVGAIFAFVASDIVSGMTGVTFAMVAYVAVITLFFDVDHAAEGGTLVDEVSTAFTKMVRERPRVLQAIGENLNAWLNAPTDVQLSKLGGLFEVCRTNIRPTQSSFE